MKNIFTLLLISMSVAVYAQPANDNCSTATPLTVFNGSCTGATAGTTTAATASNVSPVPSCGNGAAGMNDDVWYSFTPSAGQTSVNISFNSTGGSADVYAQIYTGACTGLTALSCTDDVNGLMPGWTNQAVTPGTTYYIRVASYSGAGGVNSQFGICISTPPAPPANDNCNGAISIPAYTTPACVTQTPGTTVAATQSQGGCVGNANDDVWYSFVATSTTHIVTFSGITGNTDIVHQVFSGSCTGLTSLACTDNPDNTTVSGLTIGQTYFVRVYTFGGGSANFNVCVTAPPPPPVNDNPCTATSLPIGNLSCNYTPGTNVNATTTTGVPAPGCANFNGGDVWYSFTVPASGSVTIDMNAGGMTDSGMAIYTGPNCNNLTLLECDDDDGTGLMSQIVRTGLTPGSTIWVRVWEYGGDNQGTFGICVQDDNPSTPCGSCSGPAPTNDACSGAYNLGTLPTPAPCPGSGLGSVVSVPSAYATNACATHENPYSVVSGCSQNGSDVWYQFNVTANTLVINLSSQLQQANASLWQQQPGGNCNNLIPRGCYQSTNGNINNFAFPNLVPGVYYLQISGGAESDRCNFTSLTVRNNNDCNACLQGNNLTVNPPPVNGFYSPGTTVTFCYTVTSYNQTSVNWLHGVSPVMGPGWTNLIPFGAAQPSPSGTWGWYNSVQGTATCGGCGIPGGPGWYFETTLGNNGIGTGPGNNFGDPNITGNGNWQFCWQATTLPPSSCPGSNGVSLNMTIYTYGDSQTGSWNSAGCQNDPNYLFNAALQCCTLTATIGGGGTICQGGSAPIEVSFNGGAAPWTFTYSINGGGPLSVTTSNNPYTFNTSTTGTITLLSVSSAGCTGTVSGTANITVIPTLNAVLSGGGTFCGTGSDNLLVTVSGTNGQPFTINYVNSTTGTPGSVSGTTSPVFIPVTTPGVYQLTGITTTQNGVTCPGTFSGSATLTINPIPNPPMANPVTLCGPGVVNLTASGCAGGTINWFDSPGSTTVLATGTSYSPNVTASTTYYVECTVAGCISTRVPVVVTIVPNTATAVPTTTTCGLSNGSITVTTNIVSPTFSWSPAIAGNPQNPTGLPAGTYTVTVSGGGCTATATATIAPSALPTASAAPTNTTCGQNNGSITVTTNLPTPTFNWSPAIAGNPQNPTGLPSGTYTVTVTGGGCSTTATATITPSALPSASAIPTTTTCGQNNGSITVTTNLPSPTFNWSPAIAGNPQNPTGLPAGTYTVTVTGGGCSTTATATISPSTLPTASAVPTPTTCGQNNGSITVTTNLPTPTFNWSPAIAGNPQNPTGLPSGTYTVTVTGGGCSTTATATITPSALPTASIIPTPTTCGLNNGSLSVTTNLPSPNFNWSPAIAGNPQNPTGLPAGTYTVTVTGGGCSTTATATITPSTLPTASATPSTTTCGQNNGSITVTTNMPSPSFNWSPAIAGNPQNPTGLPAGTYTVTVTGGGCSTTATATISPSTLPSATAVPTPTTCGQNNGSITVTTNLPTPTFNWSPAIAGNPQNPTGLPSGTYTVTVTGGGCSTTATATISPSALPTASVIPTATTCGLNNGSLSVTTNLPSPTFNWSPAIAGNPQNPTGLAPGTYTVTVTGGGCSTTATATISPSTLPTASATPTTTTCGQSNGSITVTTNLPSPTFNWSPAIAGNPQNPTGLPAGTYTVFVTGGGCSTTATATISPSTLPTASAVPIPGTCGQNNGSITVTTNLPTPTFNWSPAIPGNPQNPIGLSPGTYTVTVTGGGCSTTATAIILLSTPPSASAVPTSTTCGQNNGSITVTTNLTSPTFNWSPVIAGNPQNPTGLPAGTYTVTVTGGGCSTTATATITPSTLPTASATPTTTTCGQNNGSITVTTNLPSPTFNWSPAIAGNPQNPNGLPAGTYTVTVTGGGCSTTATATISPSTLPTASALPVSGTCGQNNGSITVTTNLPTPTFSWSPAIAGNPQNPTGLAAGTYTVTVTGGGCSTTATATILPSTPPSASAVSTPTTCGQVNGSITVTTNLASPTFNWSPAIAGNPQNPSGLPAGTYTVTVTGGGCSSTATATISPSTLPTASATPTTTTCGQNNGSISVTTNLPTPTFNWSPSIPGNPQNPSGLAPGTYTVTVTGGGCTATATAIISPSTLPVVSAIPLPGTCGQDNGSISVSTNLPSPTFNWSPSIPGNPQNPTNLAPGTYTVTVSGGGCSTTATATIVPSTSPIANAVPTSTTCGQTNGSISVTTNLPSPVFVWSPAIAGNPQNPTGLSPGTYTVTVSGGGCTATATATISPSTLPTASATPVPTTCGQNNGSITVVTNLPSPTYSWSPAIAGNPQNPTGLAPGTYVVTVTGGGCSVTATATISPSILPTASAIATPTSCGQNDGTITVTTNLNSPVFNWSPSIPGNPQNPAGLPSGTYTVTVTGNGCSTIATATIAPSPVPTATATALPTTCGSNNGSITVITNIVSPNFAWSPVIAGNPQNPTGLPAGNYTVTVSGNGCSTVTSVSIAPSVVPTASATPAPTTCGQNNGSINVSTNLSPATFSWSPAIAGNPQNPTGLAPGTYTVTITDGICSVTATASIASSILPIANAVPTPTNCGQNDGTITVTTNLNSPVFNWSPAIPGNPQNPAGLSPGTYTVTVIGGGCSATATATIAPSPLPTATATPTPTNCGVNNGSIIVTTNINTPTFNWSPSISGNPQNPTGLPAGTYSVTVSGNGCSSITSAIIAPSPVPVASTTAIETTCGLNNGSIIVTTNIVSPVFNWSPAIAGNPQNPTNLPSGTYTVTVSGGGCSTTATAIIDPSLAPVVSVSVLPTTCGQNNGSIIVMTDIPFPSFSWSPAIAGNPQNPTGLPSGTYTVTITGSICSATATAVVAPSAPPVANAGPDQNICTGQSANLMATGGGTYTWSDGLGNTASVTTPVLTATTMYTVTVTTGICSSTDNVIINISTITANAGPDQSICHGETATLMATGGGNYQWSGGLGNNANVTTPALTSTTTYIVTVSNAICASTDVVTVVVNTVTANAGPDQTICEGFSTTLMASGGGTYQWSNSLGNTVSVNTPVLNTTTTYTLTVTNNGCSDTDQVTVNVSNVYASIIAPITGITCITPGPVNLIAIGGSSYLWDNGLGTSASVSVNPVVNTTYHVTVYDATGNCSDTASVLITVNAVVPTVTIQPDIANINCFNPTALLSATGSSDVTSYNWGGGNTLNTFTATFASTYIVTVTSNSGCTATASAVVNGDFVQPQVIIVGNTSICEGDFTTLLASGADTYLWNNGSSNASILVSPVVNTTYNVIGTGLNGCRDTVSATVLVGDSPVAVISGNAIICQGDIASLNILFTGNPPFSFEYIDENGIVQSAVSPVNNYVLNVSPSTNATYSLNSVFTGNNCFGSVSGQANVTVFSPLITSNLSTNCNGGGPGSTYTVTFTITGGNAAAYTVNGSVFTGSTFTSLPIPTNTPYNFTVNDGGICGPIVVNGVVSCTCPTYAGTMDMTPLALCSDQTAVATHNGDEILEADDNLVFVLHTNAGVPAGNIAVSSTPSFNFTAGMVLGQTYYISAVAGNAQGSSVNFSDLCLSVSAGTPVVFYGPPSAFISGNATLCQGQSANIIIDFSGTGPYTFVYAIDGIAQTSITTSIDPYVLTVAPTVTTVYNLLNVSNFACSSGTVSGTATINVIQPATASLEGGTAVCPGSTVPLTVNFTGNGPFVFTYTVNNGNPMQISTVSNPYTFNVTPSITSTYTLTSVSVSGCPGTITGNPQVVTVIPIPHASMGYGGIICVGESFVLELSFQGTPPFNYTYTEAGIPVSGVANFNFADIVVSPTVNTTYTITSISDANGCIGTVQGISTAVVQVRQPPIASIYGGDPICPGGNDNIAFSFINNAPFYFTYLVNGTNLVMDTATTTPLLINVSPAQTTTYTLISVSNDFCDNGTASGSTMVTVNSTPGFVLLTDNCINSNQYVVSFQITGGTAPYTVSGTPGTLNGNIYTTNPIAVGTAYNCIITDANSCTSGPVNGVVSFCSCFTEAGTMNLTPLQACSGETITATHNGNEFLEVEDTLVFILHSLPGTPIGTIYATSASPVFGMLPGMNFETTYYISAVAGNIINGSIDLLDSCLSVSQGTPVVFHALPDANIIGGGNICSHDCTDVPVNLTGQSPFTLNYTINGTPYSQTNINTNPWIFNLCPADLNIGTGNIVLDIVDITDAHSCSKDINDMVTYTVIPDVVINLSGAVCAGQTISFHNTPYGVGSYNTTWPGSGGNCDTVVSIVVTQIPDNLVSIEETICEGSVVVIHNTSYNTAGVFNQTWTGLNGSCDTLATITINVLPKTILAINDTICPGESVTIHGETYSFGGTFNLVWPGSNTQCDTLATINIVQIPNTIISIQDTICPGGTTVVHGVTYNAPGIINTTWPGLNDQCDSLVTITIVEIPNPLLIINDTICPGDIALIHGSTYSAGNFMATWPGLNGQCDTLVEIEIIEIPNPVLTITENVCPGQTTVIHGQTFAAGTFNVIWTGTNGQCDTLVEIEILEIPNPVLTITENVCPGETTVIHGQTYTTGTFTVTWTGTNGQCDTFVTIFVNQIPNTFLSINDTVCVGVLAEIHGDFYGPGNHNVTWTGSNGQCDTLVTINIIEIDQVNVTLSEMVCPAGSVIVHGISYGVGNFTATWPGMNGDCDTVAVINVAEVQNILVTLEEVICEGENVTIRNETYDMTGIYNQLWPGTNGQCDTITTINVLVNPLIQVSMNPVICSGESVTVGGNAYDVSGTYTIILPASNGCDTVVTLNLTVSPPLTLTSMNVNATCELNNGSIAITATGGINPLQFSINGGNSFSSSGVFADLPSGSYNLVVSDSIGCQQTTTASLIAIPSPLADAGMDDTLTCLVSSITIGGNNTTTGPQISYSWSGAGISPVNINDPHPVVTMPDQYELTVTDNITGCTDIDMVFISIDPNLPVANAGADQTLNCILPLVTLNGTASSNGPGIEYTWTGPDITAANEHIITPQVGIPGTYELQVLNTTNNCITTSTVEVLIDSIRPIAIVKQEGTLNCFTTEITLDGTSSIGENLSLDWLFEGNTIPGENGWSINVSEPGLYTLLVLDTINGCEDFDTITVDVNTVYPIAEAGDGSELTCNVTAVVLNGTGSAVSPLVIYEWTSPDGNITGSANNLITSANEPGWYFIAVMDTSNMCVNYDSVYIEADLLAPDIAIDVPSLLDCQHGSSALSAEGSSGQGNLSYQWSNNATQAATNVFNPGWYYLTVTDAFNGCSGVDSVQVYYDPTSPIPPTSLEIEICEGESYAVGTSTYFNEGNYTDTLSSFEGCDSIVNLALAVIPTQYNTISSTICAGESYSFGGQEITTQGVYSDTIASPFGCNIITTLDLIVYDLVLPEPVDDIDTLPIGQNAYVEVLLNDLGLEPDPGWDIHLTVSPTNTLYNWVFADNIFQFYPPILFDETVTATYTICDPYCPDNCVEGQIVIVYTDKERKYIIITPNGDGLNDAFVIPDLADFENPQMIIYNRWGSVVWEKQPYENDWYGQNMKGEILPEGTYYYIAKLSNLDGDIRRGSVTVKWQ